MKGIPEVPQGFIDQVLPSVTNSCCYDKRLLYQKNEEKERYPGHVLTPDPRAIEQEMEPRIDHISKDFTY